MLILYLIHAPHTRERLEQYSALEALRAEGLCRSIGVSNYGIHHLEELLAVCTVPPCVNQVRDISVWCLHAIDASNLTGRMQPLHHTLAASRVLRVQGYSGRGLLAARAGQEVPGTTLARRRATV